MDGALRIALLALAATLPAALIHELGRALVALTFTRGRVCVLLGSGRPLFALRVGRLMVAATARWWWGGECLHAPSTSRRRATAILLAGPLLGDLCFVAAAVGALSWHAGPQRHAVAQLAIWVFGFVAFLRAGADLIGARRARA